MKIANTLAYYDTATITAVNCFKVQAQCDENDGKYPDAWLQDPRFTPRPRQTFI